MSTNPGRIQLGSLTPIPPEVLADMVSRVEQAGLEVVRTRTFIQQQPDSMEYIVEVVAQYDALTADEYGSLFGSILDDYWAGGAKEISSYRINTSW